MFFALLLIRLGQNYKNESHSKLILNLASVIKLCETCYTAKYGDNDCVNFPLPLLYFDTINNGAFCCVFRSQLIQKCGLYSFCQAVTKS